MHASHELDVSVVSPEEAKFGTAEFRAGEAASRIPMIRTTPTLLEESLLGPDLDQCARLPGLEMRDLDSPSL
jgi:hypothetical protein